MESDTLVNSLDIINPNLLILKFHNKKINKKILLGIIYLKRILLVILFEIISINILQNFKIKSFFISLTTSNTIESFFFRKFNFILH